MAKILVIDDDPILEIVKVIFEEEQYEVELSLTGNLFSIK